MKQSPSFSDRVRASWSQASFGRAIPIAVVLLLLAVTMAGLLGPFGLSIFDEPGSAADWVAAIGTWAIGYGAISLSIGDRALKLRERQERRVADLERNLEELQKVAQAAKSAGSEFNYAHSSLEHEIQEASAITFKRNEGFGSSAGVAHVRRTAYFLAWTPTQLRLLSPQAAALADDVNRKAERIISRCDQVPGMGHVNRQVDAAIDLQRAVREILPTLAALQTAADTDSAVIQQAINRIQIRLDQGID